MNESLGNIVKLMHANAPDENDALDDFWDALTEYQRYLVNAEYLKTLGNPEHDYFVSWEPGRLDIDKQITNYETLEVYDLEWVEFQKKMHLESIHDQKQYLTTHKKDYRTLENIARLHNSYQKEYGNGYKLAMKGDWVRLIDSGRFLYAQIISLKWFAFYMMEEFLSDLVDVEIPYTMDISYAASPMYANGGRRDRYNANGREKELDVCLSIVATYKIDALLDRITQVLSKYETQFYGVTFRQDTGYDYVDIDGNKTPNTVDFSPFTDFIFCDVESARRVIPTKFLHTFTENQKPWTDLEFFFNDLKTVVTQDFKKMLDQTTSVVGAESTDDISNGS